jgi:hypothetical protein
MVQWTMVVFLMHVILDIISLCRKEVQKMMIQMLKQ